MDLTPLATARPPIPLHATAAFGAVFLGAVKFALPKGTMPHRWMGYAWVSLMLCVALSSFFIHGFRQVGPFSWIHLLSAYTLLGVISGVRDARAGRMKSHRNTMTGVYVGALIITGAFTFTPGRVMHEVVWP